MTSTTAPSVATVADGAKERAIATIVTAFTGDPLVRWVLPDPHQYLTYRPEFVRRFCGNYFNNGDTCSSPATPGEIFVAGVSFTGDTGTDEFRDLTYGGYPGTISIGDQYQALTGSRTDWGTSMESRLAEGRNEFTLAVVWATVTGSLMVEVFDFVKVLVTAFSTSGSADTMAFQITRGVVSTMSFATESQGYDIGSVLGVKIN